MRLQFQRLYGLAAVGSIMGGAVRGARGRPLRQRWPKTRRPRARAIRAGARPVARVRERQLPRSRIGGRLRRLPGRLKLACGPRCLRPRLDVRSALGRRRCGHRAARVAVAAHQVGGTGPISGRRQRPCSFSLAGAGLDTGSALARRCRWRGPDPRRALRRPGPASRSGWARKLTRCRRRRKCTRVRELPWTVHDESSCGVS